MSVAAKSRTKQQESISARYQMCSWNPNPTNQISTVGRHLALRPGATHYTDMIEFLARLTKSVEMKRTVSIEKQLRDAINWRKPPQRTGQIVTDANITASQWSVCFSKPTSFSLRFARQLSAPSHPSHSLLGALRYTSTKQQTMQSIWHKQKNTLESSK